MVLLIAQQDMVEERAVTGQEGTRNVQRHGVPQLTFLCFLFDRKVLKLVNFIFKLNDEPDLSRSAKIAHNQKTNYLQKAVSREALLIPAYLSQLLKLQRAYLHNIPNIEILYPFSLV